MERTLYFGTVDGIEIILTHDTGSDVIALWQNGCIVSQAKRWFMGEHTRVYPKGDDNGK